MLEEKIEMLNNQIRQLMLLIEASVKLLAGGAELVGTTPTIEVNGDTIPLKGASFELGDPTSTGELPEGNIEWDNVDSMDCPYHSGMMSGSYGKNKTGKNKGCWSKIKNVDYSQEQYVIDRRLLIDLRADREDATEETEDAAPTTTAPTANKPPQASKPTPPPMKPQTELLEVDEEGISFAEVCNRHVAKHGPEELQKRLTQCAIERDHDYSTMEGDKAMDEVVPWVRAELIQHDATTSA